MELVSHTKVVNELRQSFNLDEKCSALIFDSQSGELFAWHGDITSLEAVSTSAVLYNVWGSQADTAQQHDEELQVCFPTETYLCKYFSGGNSCQWAENQLSDSNTTIKRQQIEQPWSLHSGDCSSWLYSNWRPKGSQRNLLMFFYRTFLASVPADCSSTPAHSVPVKCFTQKIILRSNSSFLCRLPFGKYFYL